MSKKNDPEKKSSKTKVDSEEKKKIKTNQATKTTKISETRPSVKKLTSKSEHTLRVPTKRELFTSESTPNVSKRKVPITPPSKRVTTSQYFGKSSFTAAKPEKTTKAEPNPPKNQPKIKPSKPYKSNVKIKVPVQERLILERPRTATLKKGSIINAEHTIPDNRNTSKQSDYKANEAADAVQTDDDQHEEDYEDDFDSYESDFEQYASSETSSEKISETEAASCSSCVSDTEFPAKTVANSDEERKLDSGNFDLLPDVKHKPILDDIKEAIVIPVIRSNLPSLSDEGFEDVKSPQFERNDFINFSSATKRTKVIKLETKKSKRGEDLLNMIKLDNKCFTLFELPPIPYEIFMRTYGKRNTIEVKSQTGEDNLDEIIQTDVFEVDCKWTQMPAKFSNLKNKPDLNDPNYLVLYKQEFKGVGNELEKLTDKKINVLYDEIHLKDFMETSGQLIIDLLNHNKNIALNEFQASTLHNFSEGFIEFNTSHEVLSGTYVQIIYSENEFSKILTVHKKKNRKTQTNTSLICLWLVTQPDMPENIFKTLGDVTCCCVYAESSEMVFAGLDNGSIVAWDTLQDGQYPKFMTEIGAGHFCKVVAICIFARNNDVFENSDVTNDKEICSLDEEGNMIFWSVISGTLAHNKQISLQNTFPEIINLCCTEMIVSGQHIFTLTINGFILHNHLSGSKQNPKKFISETSVSCLQGCPFSDRYFLAGFQTGRVALYDAKSSEKPLMFLQGQNGVIKTLQWSLRRPSVFYVIKGGCTVEIWNLAVSDMQPVHSVLFPEEILSFRLLSKEKGKLYSMIGTIDGGLNLHVLSGPHQSDSESEFREEFKKLSNYLNRL